MRKILITGGAGFIGSNLVEKLVVNGDLVIAMDNFDPYYDPRIKEKNIDKVRSGKNFILIKEDIRNYSYIKKVVEKYSPEYVVHLAAKVGVRNSIVNPAEYMEVNVLGTVNLLEALKNIRLKNFIFASSSSVYGANKKLPFSEDDRVDNQLSPYAVSKASAELYCQQFARLYKIPMTILRFFTVYGLRQRPDMAVSKFINKIKRGEEVEIYGNRSLQRDFIYIDDIISGIIKTLNNSSQFEIINLGFSTPVSINSLISLLEELLNKKVKRKYSDFQQGDIQTTHADISKAKKLLNWRPSITLKKGLFRTLKSLKV